MKVYIGAPVDRIGPHRLVEKIFFWVKKYDDVSFDHTPAYDRVYAIGDWLSDIPGVRSFCDWINSKKKRRINVKLHRYDTWNVDDTLAHVILPVLKQLRDHQSGAPYVNDEDVPENLRYYDHEDFGRQYTFEFYNQEGIDKINCDTFTRWDWVLGEMIFAFENIVDRSWEEQFYSGEADYIFIPVDKEGNECSDENSKFSKIGHGPKHTYKWDFDGYLEVQKRIDNGVRLFGRYYGGLWD
jgi:hypothetical protein